MDVPLEIVSAVVSGAAAFGAAIGLMRGQLREQARRLERLETAKDEHAKQLTQALVEATRTAARVSDFAELKHEVVRAAEFTARMGAQDEALAEIRIALDRKVSLSSMTAGGTEGPPLPPVRPRLPSRPR